MVKHACEQQYLEHQGMILKVCENALYPEVVIITNNY